MITRYEPSLVLGSYLIIGDCYWLLAVEQMARTSILGKKVGLHHDKTTTGATFLASITTVTNDGIRVLRVGDSTTRCPKCRKEGILVTCNGQ